MACYGALVSLKETIERLLESSKLNGENRGIIEFNACEMVNFVLSLLQKHDVSCGLVDEEIDSMISGIPIKQQGMRDSVSERSRSIRTIGQRMHGVDGKMREAARGFEDALETHLLLNHDDLQQQEKLKQDIDSFSRKVMELKEEYAKAEEEAEELDEYIMVDDDDLSSGYKKMVGYSDVLAKMKDEFLSNYYFGAKIKALVGMAGIGKTTLARRFFEDPDVLDLLEYRMWVHVGPKNQFIDILKSILNQVNPNTIAVDTLTEKDELVSQFYAALEHRRCLIVLDDVWNKGIIPPVRELLLGSNNPHRKISQFLHSTIIVTSRLTNIGGSPTYLYRNVSIQVIQVRFMNKDESWDLLRDKVFGVDLSLCTPELVKAGKKIADNCEGLPLTIVTVADILSKRADETTMTPEYWNQVAEGKNSVFFDAYQQMSKVLLRSYEFLPRDLKEYFLYMGAFPKKYDITLSKLTLLLVVEGCFLPTRDSKNIKYLQDYVYRHMEVLIRKSLVLVRKKDIKNKPKTCGLHSALWHSCVGEADTNKFFHVFNKYADSLDAERMRNQRRLCVNNNVLFGIKDVRDSMASISSARSLLCNGPHHPYPVLVCFDLLRLLRVIDALTIRFYEFPAQVVELVRLRYLALTCDGKLPISISKLSNLEVLIVRRYLNIVKLHKKDESSSLYMPTEIWDMKELLHLQVIGEDLPEPCAGVVLPNLATLMDSNARSCTKGVLQGLPNLKKLGIRIELSTDDAEPLSICYRNNNDMPKSIKCVVVNPVLRRSPNVSSLVFPNRLKKMSLNGLGCPWEDINKAVASLPKLKELKLRCYAFRGAEWETPEEGFPSLKLLLIEDTDLVHWTIGYKSFSNLRCLLLKDCYKLQDIRPVLYNTEAFLRSLVSIEIVDCSLSAVACVKQMEVGNSYYEIYVSSSLDDDAKKLKA